MKIREFSVFTQLNESFKKKFNGEMWCTSELLWRETKDLESSNFAKVCVILGNEDRLETFGKVYCKYKLFDFDYYFEQNVFERKKLILDILYDAVLSSELLDVKDVEKLNRGYENCLDKRIENKWLFKNKYFKSPNNNFYGGIECSWNLDKFTATLNILNKEKSQILKSKTFETEPYLGDFIYFSKCGWINNDFFLEDKNKKKWKVSITS